MAILNFNSFSGFSTEQPWNPKPEASLFLNKLVKYVNKGMCGGVCIVIVNGKLAEIAGMNLFFLFGITTTKNQPYNCMRVSMMTRIENGDASKVSCAIIAILISWSYFSSKS